jgi:PEP-CTERM motif
VQLIQRILPALAAVAFSASAFAAPVLYTSSAAFLAQLAPGAYTETFTGMSNPAGTSENFSGSGFSYTASSVPFGLYLEGGFLGANQVDESVTLTFGANVYAIGANFFATDIADDFQVAAMTILLSDGSVTTFTPTSLGDSYRGFVSDVAITSLTLTAGPNNRGFYAGLDDLTVGAVPQQLPEPASLALAGLALAGLAAVRRRSA